MNTSVRRLTPVFVLVALATMLAAPTGCAALAICAHKNAKTGAIKDGTTLKLRATCKASEQQVDPAAIGLQSAVANHIAVRTGNQITTNGTLTTPAVCDTGEVATGGGAFSLNNSGGIAAIRSSRPDPDTDGATPTGWRVRVQNIADTGTITVTAYAVCIGP